MCDIGLYTIQYQHAFLAKMLRNTCSVCAMYYSISYMRGAIEVRLASEFRALMLTLDVRFLVRLWILTGKHNILKG